MKTTIDDAVRLIRERGRELQDQNKVENFAWIEGAYFVLVAAWLERRVEEENPTCYRCHKPHGGAVVWHRTQVSEHEAYMPLCEPCWSACRTPDGRLPYYRAMAEKRGGLVGWAAIEQAVREGK
jgi:hypothetical protein